MKAFADLFAALEDAAETGDQVALLTDYLRNVPVEDRPWAVQLLTGEPPEKTVTPQQLREWICQVSGTPDWLFGPCREAVEDLAETAALLYPTDTSGTLLPLRAWLEDRLLPLAGHTTAQRRSHVQAAWSELDQRQQVIWNKLLIGAYRSPVAPTSVADALADISGIEPAVLSRRLDGFEPTTESYHTLVATHVSEAEVEAARTAVEGAQPRRLDAVLIYAQRGRGQRAAFYCDLTFGLWRDGALVPFTKTDAGLDKRELEHTDAFVRRHVVERFGPVRAVEPRLVFTLAFDGLEHAPRRKSGLKVLSPRVDCFLKDRRPEDADSLDAALALLNDDG